MSGCVFSCEWACMCVCLCVVLGEWLGLRVLLCTYINEKAIRLVFVCGRRLPIFLYV